MAPESFALSVVLWLAIGQCIPILVTGGLWAVWGTSPGKRALHLRIVDADTGEPMTVKQAGLRTLGYLLSFATCGAGCWFRADSRRRPLCRSLTTVCAASSLGEGYFVKPETAATRNEPSTQPASL